MEYGNLLSDSINYAIDAVWKKWARWVLLLVSTIIFPLLYGYVMEIYRGTRPAPELQQWGRLFIDGLKYLAAWIIYMLPVLAVILIFGGWAFVTAMEQSAAYGGPEILVLNPDLLMPIIEGFLIGLVIAIVLAIIISVIAIIGIIRMARKDRFGEAFNFGEIFTTIRQIGWGSYILALIVLAIVLVIFSVIMILIMAIPYVGIIIYFFLLPPLAIFQSRYLTQVYESGEPAAPVQAVAPGSE
jgi:Protein of unknown function (DUF4013)